MKNKLKDHLSKIKQRLSDGQTYQQVAREFECSRERVRQLAKQWGLFPHLVRREQRNKALFQHQKDKWGNRDTTPEDLYNAQKAKFTAKRANARKAGQTWEIAFGDIDWPTHCPVLGIELDYFAEGRKENSVSFDRHSSDKGYIMENVQIISWRANRIKNDGTADEHRKIAEYLSKAIDNKK